MPTMRRSCISTVSCLGLAWGGAGAPLPQSSSPFLAAIAQPHPPAVEAPSSGPSLSLPAFPVKVPTRRTFVDPQSCGDPLQAVHLFAKELDTKSVTVEKSLGAGKLGIQEALCVGWGERALPVPQPRPL